MRNVAMSIYLILTSLSLSTKIAGAITPAWEEQEIATGWQLKSLSPRPWLEKNIITAIHQGKRDEDWLDVPTMPAMVHDTLVHHGKIEAPWRSGAAEACQWVSDLDWLYACQFSAPQSEAPARLRFLGLDTLVDVYLNGEHVASHWNMYLPLEIDVTGRLKPKNTLILHFHTVFIKAEG
ncbi:hypothetical protein ACFL6U_18560, partial [Planctomycetota bacterium]